MRQGDVTLWIGDRRRCFSRRRYRLNEERLDQARDVRSTDIAGFVYLDAGKGGGMVVPRSLRLASHRSGCEFRCRA